jgi:hypothetical protein
MKYISVRVASFHLEIESGTFGMQSASATHFMMMFSEIKCNNV